MSESKKPTNAQAAWLRAIHKGNVHRTGHSWVNGMRNRSGVYDAPAESSYTMTCALHDAGWITEGEAKPDGPYEDRYPLVLTDAGRAAIGVEIPIPSQGGCQEAQQGEQADQETPPLKRFEARHILLTQPTDPQRFTELDAPDWLTSAKTWPGSTMDHRWFWADHVLKLGVGQTLLTEFHAITRIE